MGIIVSTNFARATVSSPPSGTGGLSFSVAAGKGALFPSPGAGEYFYGVFTNAARSAYEVVKIESRSTDSFTIATGGRGQDSSTAATWAAGDIFLLPATRKMHEETSFSAPSLALAGVTPAADKLPYFTSGTAATTTTLTTFARSILDDTDAATARTTLDVPSTATLTALLPAGVMLDYAGTSTPTGFLACDGSAVSRTTYATLFAAIGTTWGVGDGSTTFNLPDARRRVAVGSGGSGTATLGASVGNTGGAETHTLTTAQIPAHSHSGTTGNENATHTHNQQANTQLQDDSAEGLSWVGGTSVFKSAPGGTTAGQNQNHQHAFTTNTDGGSGGAHNIMQPSYVITKIIKT